MNPMNHENWHEDLKAYVDGELTAAQVSQIEGRLSSEPARQQEVIDLREITNTLKKELDQPKAVGKEVTLKLLTESAKADTNKQESLKERGLPALYNLISSRNMRVWGSLAACLALLFALQTGLAHQSGDKTVEAKTSDPTLAAATPAITSPDSPKIPVAGARMEGAQPTDSRAFTKSQDSMVSATTEPMSETVHSSMAPTATVSRPRVARTANLTVAVGDVVAQSRSATKIFEDSGALITLSDIHVNPDPGRSQVSAQIQPAPSMANIDAEVPSEHLDQVLTQLEGLGTVRSQTVQAEQVTAQVKDVSTELKAVQDQFNDDAQRLESAKTVRDVKRLKELMSEAREQIRDLTNQKTELSTRVSKSHVSLVLIGNSQDRIDPNDTWNEAKQSLGEFGGVVLKFLIFALVWSPVWVPLGLFANYWSRRSGPRN